MEETLAYIDKTVAEQGYARIVTMNAEIAYLAATDQKVRHNRTLKERMGDFNRVERALGRDTVETIVLREKRLEEEQRVQRRKQKRKMDRDAR